MTMDLDDLDEEDVQCDHHWHCDPVRAAHVCDRPDRTAPCPSCGERPIDEVGMRHALKRGWSERQYTWARKHPKDVAYPWW